VGEADFDGVGEPFVYAVTRSSRTVDAGSLAELIDDCRDISAGVFPPARPVNDLARQVPAPRVPGPAQRREVVIRDSVVSLLDGYSEYGS
jgi:hypothetical protein